MTAQSFCPQCGKVRLTGAPFCAHCGRQFGPGTGPSAPTRPRRTGPRLVGVLIVGLLLLAAIGGLSNAGTTSGAAPSATQTPQPTPDYTAARYIDPRAIASDPARYRGVNLWLQGQALSVEQHDSGTWVQIMAQPVGSTATESIVVTFDGKATDLIKGKCYQIYAVGDGTSDVTRTLTGATNTVAAVRAYRYGSAPATTYGCAAPTN